MIRSIHTAAASVAGLLMLAADTGANAGGTATLDAPPAAPASNPANPAAGETVTATAGTPGTPGTGDAGTPAAGEKKPKRGKGAAGMSVFVVDSLAAALANAKERGNKFTAFTVKVDGKPDRFFVSNHRNAVQHRILTDDGYTMFSGDGTNKGGRKPADPTKRADELLAGMDEATRRALFAKYIGTNPAAAAALPGAPPRDDTTADFAAATAPAATPATPAVPATPAAAPAAAPANTGNVPPVGNQPAGKGATPAGKGATTTRRR